MKHSIISKITIIFVIAFALVCALFITFGNMQTNKAYTNIRANEINAINYLLRLYEKATPPSDLEKYFRNFGFHLVRDKNIVTNVITSGEKEFTQNTPIGIFESIKYGGSIYLTIKNETFLIVFEGLGTQNLNDPLWIGFILTVIVLFYLYLSMIKSFSPLKKLTKNIKKFGAGNLDVVIIDKKREDEIGELADEFNLAVSKIRELVYSRQLFLRTIMHELKTPIGKGRIISEMIDSEVQKNRLISVFERLEILINEFAKIEQLLSKNYALKYQECHFSLILEQVRDILLLDNFDEKISVCMNEDAIINVDFQLFTLALKNLIDNALKYSDDKKVRIICDNDKISVQNTGKPLLMSFEHYKQAFVRNNAEKVSGIGLGLYIIDKICAMHNFHFEHSYCANMHTFSVIFDKPAISQKNKKSKNEK